MKIVKFKDGTYGVRRLAFPTGYEYRDIDGMDHWWFEYDRAMRYGKGTYEQGEKVYNEAKRKGYGIIEFFLRDRGTPVK